ncbi:MAG TPA: methyltransferase domain-containing protein [Candidatus Omnitrophota bacterium]|nr:methyltransferase domain-containing protein [Candidatus Omnitrophota bacterium]
MIHTLLEKFLILNFNLQRIMLKKAFFVKPKTPALLKSYLTLDQETRQNIITKSSISVYGGIHPKNIYNFRSEFFLEHVIPQDTVIDIGCGSGVILEKCAPYVTYGYGIDWSEETISLCKKKQGHKNLEFIKADLGNFDFPAFRKKSGYTMAFFSHILEHVENPGDLLKRVSAQKILICVPSQENWLAQLKVSLGVSPLSDPTHFKEYTRKILALDVVNSGYTITYMGFNSEGEIVCSAKIA